MVDYTEIGLKCGLEIHQQLDTKKLFCDCPSQLRDDDPHYKVRRKLRAVVGETGTADRAALMEQKRERSFLYEGYNDTTCLIELDEEPIRPINPDALSVALQVSKMLNAHIVHEIQCMRKTVVDGSNTSGFQRTCLIAMNGEHEIAGLTVGFPTICVEEDAARKINDKKGVVTYRLDRLGIPLIELATTPVINDPDKVREVAEYIGMILRSTGKVKRGLGTIRQDVNVSIKGGSRIEIKGAQDLRNLHNLVVFEVERQKNLINLKNELRKFVKPQEFNPIDVTRNFHNCDSKLIASTIKDNGKVMALLLPGFKGILGNPVCEGRRVGSEVSDYAKVSGNVGGIFHLDELPKYGISEVEVDSVAKTLNMNENDSFILVCDQEDNSMRALEGAFNRIQILFERVPEEVRRAKDDGTSEFMRPLSGGHRLYPETDFIPVVPDLSKIKLPELINHKINRFEKQYAISHDLAMIIAKQGIDLDELVKKYRNLNATVIIDTLINKPKELKKRFGIEVDIEPYAEDILKKLDSGKISKEAVIDILQSIGEGKKIDYSNYELVDDSKLKAEIKDTVNKHPGKKANVLMGIIMAKYRGKVDGQKVMQILKNLIKE